MSSAERLSRVCAALVVVCLAFPMFAIEPGKATGSITVNGKKTDLHFATATKTKDGETKVLVSNTAVPAATLADTFAMMDLKDLVGVEITFNKEKQIISGQLYDPAGFKKFGGSISATGMHKFDEKQFGSTIAGKLYMDKEDEFFGSTYRYAVEFAAPLGAAASAKPADALPPGQALAAGGGEPGAAYAKYLAAMRAGDLKKIRPLVAKKRVADMDRPDFKEMLGMIQAMMPKDVKVTGGTVSGNTATLAATGKNDDGSATKGTVTMTKEDGAWKVDGESWKN